jgi:hypothetical protein
MRPSERLFKNRLLTLRANSLISASDRAGFKDTEVRMISFCFRRLAGRIISDRSTCRIIHPSLFTDSSDKLPLK